MADDKAKSSKKKAHRPVPIVELMLVGGLVTIALDYFLGWGLLRPIQNYRTDNWINRNRTSQFNAPAIGGGAGEISPNSTHRVICNAGLQGLNFRPTAGFSTPLFAIPCGSGVRVNGAAVTAQSETWSPVIYANQQGWAASKHLQPLR